MDQGKIGIFISDMRRKQNLTQKQLADKLSISEKTISKWECGKGLPDVSLMLPLCKMLGISVNELLSGELINEQEYRENAEENLLHILKEKEESKKKFFHFKIKLELFLKEVYICDFINLHRKSSSKSSIIKLTPKL